MLWTIFVILLVLWLLGVVTSYTMGGFIHVLLIVAVVIAILQLLQGRSAVFYTALAVIGPSSSSVQVDCIPTKVNFKNLASEKLEMYLRTDQPYDCAGAAKIESLGIALIDAAESSDPTALIGLPLIRLTSMLAAAGVDVLAHR